jgi:hypothetical protein
MSMIDDNWKAEEISNSIVIFHNCDVKIIKRF